MINDELKNRIKSVSSIHMNGIFPKPSQVIKTTAKKLGVTVKPDIKRDKQGQLRKYKQFKLGRMSVISIPTNQTRKAEDDF